MKKLLSLTFILILSSVFFTSCKKSKGDPPVLPSFETMIIDFSNFNTASKSADFVSAQKGTNDSNWQFAALAATGWRLLINSTLIVPVTVFKLAADQDPAYLEEKTWQWVYTTTVTNITYSAKLVGKIEDTQVVWKLYITKSGEYTDFLWIEGTSKSDGTGGSWTINESYASPTALLNITWTKSSTSISTIRYTYLKSGVQNNTYIEYGLLTGTYNAYFDAHYYNANLAKTVVVRIEWNTTDGSGRMQSTDWLDGAWYKWDAGHLNI